MDAITPTTMEDSDLGRRVAALEERVRILEGGAPDAAPRSAPQHVRQVEETTREGAGSAIGAFILIIIALFLFGNGFSELMSEHGFASGLFLLAIAAGLGWWAWTLVRTQPRQRIAHAASPSTEIQASVVLGRIGIIIVLLGLVFLFRVAIDQGLIGPGTRIVIGVLVGIGPLWLGQYAGSKYPVWSRMFTGGGLALIYYTFYVAHTPEYAIFGDTAAFALMVLTTVLAWWLAVRSNSGVIAAYAFFGGYVTPLLVRTETPNYTILLTYVLILTIGMLGIARRKDWRILQKIAFFFTSAYLAASLHALGDGAATAFVLAFFVLFCLIPVVHHFQKREEPGRFDVVLIAMNALVTYTALAELWYGALGRGFGYVPLGLAIAFLALAAVARADSMRALRASYVILATAFLATASFIALDGVAHIATILWAILALALLWYGFASMHLPTRAAAIILLACAVVRLISVDSDVVLVSYTPVLNGRVATYVIIIAALGLGGWLYRRGKELGIPERSEFATILPVVAHLLALVLLTVEISDAFTRAVDPGNAKHVVLSVAYALYGLALLAVGIWKRMRGMRIAALVLLAATVAKVLAVDIAELEAFSRVLVYVLVGILLIVASYSYQRFKWLITDEL